MHLKGNLVIVIGAGEEGLKKINSLLTQDCKILVISDKINTQIKNYVKKKKIEFKQEKLSGVGFLTKYKPYLVMATTSDRKLNQKVVDKARKMNCLAYASDDPQISDFSHPSVINIEDSIQVAISTKGRSPIMAKMVKIKAEKVFKKIIKKEEINQIKLQDLIRPEAKKKIPSQLERKKFLYTVLNDPEIKKLIKDEKLKMAQKIAMKILRGWK